MSFLELAKNRYSERYFDPRPIEKEAFELGAQMVREAW